MKEKSLPREYGRESLPDRNHRHRHTRRDHPNDRAAARSYLERYPAGFRRTEVERLVR